MICTGKRCNFSIVSSGFPSPRPSYRRMTPVPRSELDNGSVCLYAKNRVNVHGENSHRLPSLVHPAARMRCIAQLEHVDHVYAGNALRVCQRGANGAPYRNSQHRIPSRSHPPRRWRTAARPHSRRPRRPGPSVHGKASRTQYPALASSIISEYRLWTSSRETPSCARGFRISHRVKEGYSCATHAPCHDGEVDYISVHETLRIAVRAREVVEVQFLMREDCDGVQDFLWHTA